MLLNTFGALSELVNRLGKDGVSEDTLICFQDSDFNSYIISKNYEESFEIETNEVSFKVIILDKDIFRNELEWFEALKKADGPYNERIISFCDRWHLANAKELPTEDFIENILGPFLEKIFKDFGLELFGEDGENIPFYSDKLPNYYTIKEFIIQIVGFCEKGLYSKSDQDIKIKKKLIFEVE